LSRAGSGLLVHVVGARPNFIKAAPVVRATAALGMEQRLVHTGQHYDVSMSEVFFAELGIPEPDVNLGVGSGSHAEQTAALMLALEGSFRELAPALVVVYGDVNSTLAASLVASKLQVPVAHVEAGLRSFDDSMPEEINRRVTDLLSDLLFVTCPEGLDNLAHEGVAADRVHFVGNPMIDTLLAHLDRFDVAAARREHRLEGAYAVATLHRPANVDAPEAAARIVRMLADLVEIVPLVLPLHPRSWPSLTEAGLTAGPRLRLIEPLGYVAFLSLVRGATVVVTDSGGIQEETTMLGVPCLTVRPNTERPVTISHGTNRLVEPDEVAAAAAAIVADPPPPPAEPPPLWDGHAGERIGAVIAGRRRARTPARSGA
jgi:UDP-N-acetylglucosamine 2-epimerase (non-hydrolysing)